ncbi:MAG: cytochrome-c oxidase, cbb3-type subunit III [Alphaproteobacteria bacterium]|nr:MAG: cytochrome-c oxidase, cbb3-type subunit III [Alphaproteobacteria bacterium]
MSEKVEKDEISGTQTTGHEWDGIKELDTPMPRWWLWTMYGTIIWAIGYWIVMPAWPMISSYTSGFLGYSSRGVLEEELKEANAAHAADREALLKADLNKVHDNAQLYQFAVRGGKSAFAVNCSQCHGSGAQGAPGYPNLNDDDWLWGGNVDTIYQTIRYGIRSDHEDTRVGEMPAFVTSEMLDKNQVNDAAEYVLSLSGRDTDKEAAARGQAVFKENCASCHGENAKGGRDFGAPNLTDAIWFYGGDKKTILRTISKGRHGVMPAWINRLDDVTIRELTLYVHSLGGGE